MRSCLSLFLAITVAIAACSSSEEAETEAEADDTGGVDAMVSEVNGNTVAGTNDGRLLRADVHRERG